MQVRMTFYCTNSRCIRAPYILSPENAFSMRIRASIYSTCPVFG